MIRISAPTYSVEISDEEKKQALRTRDEFEKVVKLLEAAFEKLESVRDLLDQYKDSSHFKQIKDLFIRYKHKIVHLFNDFLDQLQICLEQTNNTLTDTEMDSIRDTIVEEVRELRDGVVQISVELETPEAPEFIESFTEICNRLDKRKTSLIEIINDHLFSHIDYDILGRIKLGSEKIRLSKKGM